MNVQSKLSRLQKKVKNMKKNVSPESPNQVNSNMTTISGVFNPVMTNFLKSQEKYSLRRKGGMRWNKEDIKLAIAIYYKSPATYSFLRSHFGLPAPTIIYEEIRLTMKSSGVCQRTIEGIRYKAEGMNSLDRHCSLVLDGLKIDQCLQYLNSDLIAGYEELTNGVRSNRIASEMVALMVQGLASHWKQVNLTKYIL